jgi:ABC-2 type transport system ATP-binding protein
MIPGGHIRLRFADAGTLGQARTVLARPAGAAGCAGQVGLVGQAFTAQADDDALTLEVPTGGSVPELRGILARLTDHGLDVAELTVHTPDLDDVFLALTSD